MNTLLATAAAVLSWTFGEWMFKGKPSMLGARLRRGRRPGRDHARLRLRRHPMGAFVIGLLAGARVPLGRQRAEEDARRGRLARRVRRARRGRDTRRAADRRVLRPVARRARLLRLGHRQGDAGDFPIAAQVWTQAKAVAHDRVVRGRRLVAYADRRRRSGCACTEEEEREGLDITSHGETASAYRPLEPLLLELRSHWAPPQAAPFFSPFPGLAQVALGCARTHFSARRPRKRLPPAPASLTQPKRPPALARDYRPVSGAWAERAPPGERFSRPRWSPTSPPPSPARCSKLERRILDQRCRRSSAGSARSGWSTRRRSTPRSTCATAASSSRRWTPTSFPAASTT